VLQFLSRPIIAKSRETVGAMFTLPSGLSEALKQADLIIDHGPEAVPAPERAKPIITHHLDWLAKQASPDSSRIGAQQAGGWKPSKEIWLENSASSKPTTTARSSAFRTEASPVPDRAGAAVVLEQRRAKENSAALAALPKAPSSADSTRTCSVAARQ